MSPCGNLTITFIVTVGEDKGGGVVNREERKKF